MSRRAEAVLSLIGAKAELDRAKKNVPDYTGQHTPESYYEDEQEAYEAAVAEYESAHAPTADEIKAKVVAHLDTDVSVYFGGGQVTVSVGLRWYDDQGRGGMMRFGYDQDDAHDNQCLGECC